VAINLEQSPLHAQSVALVLSLLSEYVSAQFHLKHDDFFETVREVNAMSQSKWQELAKFTPEEMTGKPHLPSAAKD
jgi:type IV secretory pathway component VirB8